MMKTINFIVFSEIIQTKVFSPSKLTPPAVKMSPSASRLTPITGLTITPHIVPPTVNMIVL